MDPTGTPPKINIEPENDDLEMGASKNRGSPKSSIFIGFSIINHPFWGPPTFGNTRLEDVLPFPGLYSQVPINLRNYSHFEDVKITMASTIPNRAPDVPPGIPKNNWINNGGQKCEERRNGLFVCLFVCCLGGLFVCLLFGRFVCLIGWFGVYQIIYALLGFMILRFAFSNCQSPVEVVSTIYGWSCLHTHWWLSLNHK